MLSQGLCLQASAPRFVSPGLCRATPVSLCLSVCAIASPGFVSLQLTASLHLHLDLDQVSGGGQQLAQTAGQQSGARRLPDNPASYSDLYLAGTIPGGCSIPYHHRQCPIQRHQQCTFPILGYIYIPSI